MSKGEHNSLSVLLDRSSLEWRDPSSALHCFAFLKHWPCISSTAVQPSNYTQTRFYLILLIFKCFLYLWVETGRYFSAHDGSNVPAAQCTKAELFRNRSMAVERIQANQMEEISII